MTAAYVRRYYQVPAKRGGRVVQTWQQRRLGTIVAFDGQYLRVRFDDAPKLIEHVHPTWELEYL